MKKTVRVALAAVLLAVLAVGAVLWVNLQPKQPLKDLRAEDISCIRVGLYPPDVEVELSEEQTEEAVKLLRDVVIYRQDSSHRTYTGQSVVFTLTKTDGEVLTVTAFNPFFIINGVGFRTEYAPCEALNSWANDLLAENREEPGEDISAWFPCKANGCPDTGFMAVNGFVLPFGLENRDTVPRETVHAELDWQTQRITVLLPLPANNLRWQAEDAAGAVLLGERRCHTGADAASPGEGDCPYLQEFVFAVEGSPLPEALVFQLKNTDDTLRETAYYELTVALDWTAELICD